jgi:hypothetical protein
VRKGRLSSFEKRELGSFWFSIDETPIPFGFQQFRNEGCRACPCLSAMPTVTCQLDTECAKMIL